MRILTNSECKRWVMAQGLVYQPYRQGTVMAKQYRVEDAKDGGESARRAVIATCRHAGQSLLVIEDHPLTYDDRRQKLADLRAEAHEIRGIAEAPGHLLRMRDEVILARLLEIVIGPGSWWNVYVYLAPIGTTMLIWESTLIDLWTDRHAIGEILESELKPTTTA